MRRFQAAVTFESPSGPPETYRGEIVAGSWQKAASSAVRAAKAAYPGRRSCSLVVLLTPDGEGVDPGAA